MGRGKNSYGQHDVSRDWMVVRHGVTSKLKDVGLTDYLSGRKLEKEVHKQMVNKCLRILDKLPKGLFKKYKVEWRTQLRLAGMIDGLCNGDLQGILKRYNKEGNKGFLLALRLAV